MERKKEERTITLTIEALLRTRTLTFGDLMPYYNEQVFEHYHKMYKDLQQYCKGKKINEDVFDEKAAFIDNTEDL